VKKKPELLERLKALRFDANERSEPYSVKLSAEEGQSAEAARAGAGQKMDRGFSGGG
jgi:hypothetical protein